MILCCGEALIDMIPEPTKSGKQGFVPHAGGAIYNTAIALGRLGAPVGMLTGLSTDIFGQQLAAGLEASQVHRAHVVTSARPTTLAFVQLENGQANYSFYDENTAGRMLSPEELPVLDDDISALYFGGISLACEPGADAYASLLAKSAEGRVVMVDPNIRTGFIANEPRYRDRLDQMLRSADIIKFSDEDLNWFVQKEGSLGDKVASILELGPSIVILTEGEKGATAFFQDGQKVHVPSEMVEVVDTVGAGDTFNAGVLAMLSRKDLLHKEKMSLLGPTDIEEALRFGAKVAAITVSRSGANPPWASEL